MRAQLRRIKNLFSPASSSGRTPVSTSEIGSSLDISAIQPFDGVHLTLDYPVTPRCRPTETSPGGSALVRMLAARNKHYREHLRAIGELKHKLANIPLRSENPHAAAWVNNMFPGLDAAFLYTLIAREKPSRYIEIGSGTSTKFARQAIRDHALSTKIISIDPEPRADIDELCDSVVRLPFEEVPSDFFADLSENDIFFLDGSHRTFQNSDVTVFFTELLNAMPAGCFYGIHDIFLPYDYPPAWANRFYSEQYILAAYLLGGANGDQIEFPAWYLCREGDIWADIQELFDWDASAEVERHGGAFWMRRAP